MREIENQSHKIVFTNQATIRSTYFEKFNKKGASNES
jgi:hypothetical protein